MSAETNKYEQMQFGNMLPDPFMNFPEGYVASVGQNLTPLPDRPPIEKINMELPYKEEKPAELITKSFLEPSDLSISGLRRLITEKRVERAEKKIRELSVAEDANHEAVTAAKRGHLPKKGYEPVTKQEHRSTYKMDKKIDKLTANSTKKLYRSMYGSTDSQGRPLQPSLRPSYELGPDGKIKTQTYERGNDLGTEEQLRRLETSRYPRYQRKAEMKARKVFFKTNRSSERISGKIDQATSGNDIGSRFNRYRIHSADKRVTRLVSKLEKRGMKTEVSNERKQRRASRNSRELSYTKRNLRGRIKRTVTRANTGARKAGSFVGRQINKPPFIRKVARRLAKRI